MGKEKLGFWMDSPDEAINLWWLFVKTDAVDTDAVQYE